MKRFALVILMGILSGTFPLHSQIVPYTLNDVEGFFVPRVDMEKLMLGAEESVIWHSSFDELKGEFQAMSIKVTVYETIIPWTVGITFGALLVGGVVGYLVPR